MKVFFCRPWNSAPRTDALEERDCVRCPALESAGVPAIVPGRDSFFLAAFCGLGGLSPESQTSSARSTACLRSTASKGYPQTWRQQFCSLSERRSSPDLKSPRRYQFGLDWTFSTKPGRRQNQGLFAASSYARHELIFTTRLNVALPGK